MLRVNGNSAAVVVDGGQVEQKTEKRKQGEVEWENCRKQASFKQTNNLVEIVTE